VCSASLDSMDAFNPIEFDSFPKSTVGIRSFLIGFAEMSLDHQRSPTAIFQLLSCLVILHGGQRANVNPIDSSISSIALAAEMLTTPKPIVGLVSLPRIIADAVVATEARVVPEKKFRFVVNCGRRVALQRNVEEGHMWTAPFWQGYIF
jgi:hypothetical protein